MSRVIQLISHNQHLFALTDSGEIFATPSVLNAKWSLFEGPIPPRFSEPEEYDPPSTFTKPPTFRRPTSIGSDGNYIPPSGD